MKWIINFCACLALTLSANAQIKTDSLVLYYPFSYNSNDLSGNAANATAVGATLTTDRFGNPLNAYSFDGVNDFLEVPDTSVLRPQFPFALALWVKIDSLQPKTISFYSSCEVANKYSGFNIKYSSDGVVHAMIGNGFGTNSSHRKSRSSSISLKENKWHFIVAQFYGVNSMKIFIDGIDKSGAYSGTASNMVYTPHKGSIGSNLSPSGTHYHKGAIDDVRLYNDSLSPTDIQYIYYETLCTKQVDVNDTLIVLDSIAVFDTIPYLDTTSNVVHVSSQDTMFVDLKVNMELTKVYPAPSRTAMIVDFGNNYSSMTGYSVNITNQFGQQVFFQQVNTKVKTVNLMSLGSLGLFHINFLDNNGQLVESKKLILN